MYAFSAHIMCGKDSEHADHIYKADILNISSYEYLLKRIHDKIDQTLQCSRKILIYYKTECQMMT